MRKESDPTIFNCLICKEDKQFFSVGSCDHRRVCSYCCMKSRILYKDKKCPICNQKMDVIFIIESTEKPTVSEIEQNKDFFIPDDEVSENGIYFSTMDAKEEALRLRSFICPVRSCQDGAFENLQVLCTHLNKVHKRYYCETCLKESKKFLSEMQIYNYESLKEHIEYGEYSDKNVMISPPHPMCFFCNIRYFNDEILFKHMNEFHFICQLCKDKKSIIFYQEISNLLEHYKFRHYCCPYQECIDDIFVVFESEEKLNSHLITKHKCIDAQNKLTSFMFKEQKKPLILKDKSVNKGDNEINFTQYITSLKEKALEFANSLANRVKYIEQGEYDQGMGDYNYNRPTRGRRGNKGYGRGGGKKMDIFDQAIHKGDEYREVDHYDYSNKFDRRANQYAYQDINPQSSTVSGPTIVSNQAIATHPVKVDYSVIFGYFTQILKEVIQSFIKERNPGEDEFILPPETLYQLIIIIDKLENHQKLLELTSLTNFGIDIDLHRELKKIIAEEPSTNENHRERLSNSLKDLEIKKILIIYKYFSVASKKIDGLFYKLDLNQIDPDMYDDFVNRNCRKKKDIFEDQKMGLIMDNKTQGKSQAKKKDKKGPVNELKQLSLSEKEYPSLSGTQEEVVGLGKKNKSKLAGILSNDQPITSKVKKPEEHPVQITTDKPKPEPSQSKLTLLLDGKLVDPSTVKPVKKKDPWSKKKFQKDQVNYDEEFPEL